MVHVVCMKLDVPLNLSYIRIGSHLSCLWEADWALKILPNYSAVCGWLHCHNEETMLSPSQVWLDGWRFWLNFVMDFADDFVVDDLLTFFNFLEVVFAANIFRFGSHSWIFMFHRFRYAWITFVIFVSPSSACLNYLEMISPSSVCLNFFRIVRIPFSWLLLRLELSVLVIFVFRLGSKWPCLFLFYSIFSLVFVSCGRLSVSFLVLFLADAFPFLLLFCTVWSDLMELEASCEGLGVGCFSFRFK